MAKTVALISVNFASYGSASFTTLGISDTSINPLTLAQYCQGGVTVDNTYLGGFVKKGVSGDTMRGMLTLPSTMPTDQNHAARKGYVDSRIDSLSSSFGEVGSFVKITGSTMTGALTISHSSAPGLFGINCALQLTASSDPGISFVNTTNNKKVNIFIPNWTDARGVLSVGGGYLGNNAYPILHGGNYTSYVNPNDFVKITGSTMTGNLTLPTYVASNTNDNHATTKKYVDDAISSAVGSGTSGLVTKKYVDDGDALRVLKAGDTMTGALTIQKNADGGYGFNSAIRIRATHDPGITFTNNSTTTERTVNLFVHNGEEGVLCVGGGYLGSNVLYPILHSGNWSSYITIPPQVGQISGGVKGNVPYQSEPNKTTFLPNPNTINKFIGFNISTGLPQWMDTPSVGQIDQSTQLKIRSLGVNTAAPTTDGEIRATNNITAYYSDERLKNFNGKITDALNKVNTLNGYYFTSNEKAKEFGYNDKKVQVGVNAQEVERILPEIVTLAPFDTDFNKNGEMISRSGESYKTVYYDKLVPLLIEAIKELTKKVELLENSSKT